MAYEGFDVNGQIIRSIYEAFRLFPEVGLKPYTKRGIGTVAPDGRLVVEPSGWYPMGAWVAAKHEIVNLIGPQKGYEVGKQIARFAELPPTIRDIVTALDGMDVSYHMNHRKNGEVMFNPANGKMLEGIGHTRPVSGRGTRRIVVESDSPYPCDVDRGIVIGFSARFEPNIVIEHLTDAGCRKQGGERCRYALSW
jgi:hypothetical protein